MQPDLLPFVGSRGFARVTQWNMSITSCFFLALWLSRCDPEVGVSGHPGKCMKVDLPDPEGPMMATNSPRCTVTLTPASTFTADGPSP